jgi:hypothetical protein
MFDNTVFYISVFEEAPGTNATDDISSYAKGLLQSGSAPTVILSEGNRVGTLLDLKLDGSGAFQFDSANQNNNIYVDPQTGNEHHPICEVPFYHTS